MKTYWARLDLGPGSNFALFEKRGDDADHAGITPVHGVSVMSQNY
jgi:hypothetical protein